MTDEHKLIRDNSRALQAEGLLNSDLLKEAFAKLEEEYIAAWRSTKHDDQLGREKLFLAVNVIGKVKDHLQSVASNGKLAQAELNQLAANAERRRRFGIV